MLKTILFAFVVVVLLALSESWLGHSVRAFPGMAGVFIGLVLAALTPHLPHFGTHARA